jgi:hypothetical protein
MRYVEYKPDTGEIVSVSLHPDHIPYLPLEGLSYLENVAADSATQMVSGEDIVDRPLFPGLPGSGIAPLTLDLSVIPDGHTLVFKNEAGDELEVVTPSEDIVLTDPGTYGFMVVVKFPYITETRSSYYSGNIVVRSS